MRKSVTETFLPLHAFHVSSFTHVTQCIIASCGESSLSTAVFTSGTGNLPVSRHPFGKKRSLSDKKGSVENQ